MQFVCGFSFQGVGSGASKSRPWVILRQDILYKPEELPICSSCNRKKGTRGGGGTDPWYSYRAKVSTLHLQMRRTILEAIITVVPNIGYESVLRLPTVLNKKNTI